MNRRKSEREAGTEHGHCEGDCALHRSAPDMFVITSEKDVGWVEFGWFDDPPVLKYAIGLKQPTNLDIVNL